MTEYDLISKTALLRHLDMAIECKDCPRNTDRKTYYDRCACTEVADICDMITNFPTTAEVQPIKRGRWIIADDVEQFIAICSECGRTEDSRDIKDMPYCHCGARMDVIYEDDKVRAIKVTGWGDDTRNLTDEETDIYNNRLEAEAKMIDEISLL